MKRAGLATTAMAIVIAGCGSSGHTTNAGTVATTVPASPAVSASVDRAATDVDAALTDVDRALREADQADGDAARNGD